MTEIARRAGMDRAGLSDYLHTRLPRQSPTETYRRLGEIASLLVQDGTVSRCVCAAAEHGQDRAPPRRARKGTEGSCRPARRNLSPDTTQHRYLDSRASGQDKKQQTLMMQSKGGRPQTS